MAKKRNNKIPEYPNNIGKTRTLININGVKRKIKILDEIIFPQKGIDYKIFCIQKLQVEDRKPEIRIGYYMIGVKGRMKGRWTWGQYNPHMPMSDLKKMYKLGNVQKCLHDGKLTDMISMSK